MGYRLSLKGHILFTGLTHTVKADLKNFGPAFLLVQKGVTAKIITFP